MSATASQQRKLGIVARASGWAAGHRRVVLLGWIVAPILAVAASSAVGTNYGTSFSLPGTESQRAVDLLKRDFPAQSGDSDQIVLQARGASVTAPAIQARVTQIRKQIDEGPFANGQIGVEREAQILGERAFARPVETRDPDTSLGDLPAAHPVPEDVEKATEVALDTLSDLVLLNL